MSLLNQLKVQANALQQQQELDLSRIEAHTRQTEAACQTVWLYVAELAKQLNVIEPAGPALSLDGKTSWPVMKLVDFRVDARKKKLRDQDVYDYITMGWRLVPAKGDPVNGTVSANFPPDLERIEARLSAGGVKHERVHVRHPEKNTLKEIRFDYVTEARGGITIKPDHESVKLGFRLGCLTSFRIVNVEFPADQIQSLLLDELAKVLIGQPSTFCVME